MTWLFTSTALRTAVSLWPALSSGGGTEPVVFEATTLQSSVVHRSATYNFNVPVPVGTYADGTPFVVSDRAFSITSIAPASAAVASTDYIDSVSLSNVAGASFVKNGAMVNPWFKGASVGSEPQGFDGILGTAYSGASWRYGLMAYSGALNVDPGIAGAYSVSIGHEASIVKSVRKAGVVNIGDSGWRLFDDWCVLHIVQAIPEAGAFAPPIVSTSKASLFKLSQVNKGCLGSGFALSTGMPSHATIVAGDYFRPVQPYWGQNGEQRRRMIVEPTSWAVNPTTYSREFGRSWSDALAALLQQGPAANDTLFRQMLTFGSDLIGMHRRGYSEAAGAGQSAGHKQFAMLLGHGVTTFMPEALLIQGNCTHQQFWTPASLEGDATDWPGNHDIYFTPAQAANIGRPHWATEVSGGTGARPPTDSLEYDFFNDADYEFTAGLASFVEMMNIGLMKFGPSSWDGSQNITNHASLITGGEGGASLAYMDRYRRMVEGTKIYGFTNYESVLETKHRQYYDDRRNDMAIGRWTGTPDEIMTTKTVGYPISGTAAVSSANATVTGTGTTFLSTGDLLVGGYIATSHGEVRQITAIASNTSLTVASPFAVTNASVTITPYLSILYPTTSGGFSWDLSGVDLTTLPILEYQVQYSFDDKAWTNVTTQGASGTQTGLVPGLVYFVRWRRRNSAGWSPWSHNWPRESVGNYNRNIVKILGTASGTVINTVAPSIVQKMYRASSAPFYSAATTPVPLADLTITLYVARGLWTGNLSGSPTYQWKRGGVNISGATSVSYTLTPADNNTSAVTNITCDVTWGGVTAASNTVVVPQTTAAEQWIARMDVAPTGTLLTLINTFCADAVSSGAWAKLDGVWAGLHTAQAMRTNAKSSSYTLTTPTNTASTMSDADFLAHRGYKGDGIATGKYLNTGINENTSGLNWTQNSAAWGCFIQEDGGGTNAVMGTINSSNNVIQPHVTGNVRSKTHSATNATVSSGAANRLGWALGIRTSSTSHKAGNADSADPSSVSYGTAITTASSTPGAQAITIHRGTTVYAADRVTFAFVGGGFSEAELEAFIDDVAGPFVAGLLAL